MNTNAYFSPHFSSVFNGDFFSLIETLRVIVVYSDPMTLKHHICIKY